MRFERGVEDVAELSIAAVQPAHIVDASPETSILRGTEGEPWVRRNSRGATSGAQVALCAGGGSKREQDLRPVFMSQ